MKKIYEAEIKRLAWTQLPVPAGSLTVLHEKKPTRKLSPLIKGTFSVAVLYVFYSVHS